MNIQPKLSDVLYSNQLDIKKFENLISNNAQGYKFYWLEAIIRLSVTGENIISFDEIINEMIWEAWRTVTFFHLRLGPTINGKTENYLEHAIGIINGLAMNELSTKIPSRERFIRLIKKNDDQLVEDKIHLTDYVPYRLIKPFVDKEGKEYVDKSQYKRFIAYINEFSKVNAGFFYNILDAEDTLHRAVFVNEEWITFIKDNYAVIMGWLQYNKAKYIQERNPGVPGIIYKLSPESESIRRLDEARKLWKLTVEITGKPLYEIYTDKELSIENFDLDHFIPRSYIANDELWNLVPMSKNLNSSKSNRLPQWDPFFTKFADYQYYLYSLLNNKKLSGHEALMIQYDKCKKYNVNAIWALEKLYISGNDESVFKNVLYDNMKTVYEAAKLQQYELWEI